MICPNCGTENSDTARFCKSCGSRLNGPAPKSSASTPVINFNETQKLQYHDLKREIEELKVIFDIRVEEMKRISHNIEIMKNNIALLTKKQAEIENELDLLEEKLKRKIMKSLEKNMKNSFDSVSANIEELSKRELRKIGQEMEERLNEKLEERLNSELFEMRAAFKTQTKRMERRIKANFKENSEELETFEEKVRDAVNPLLKRLDIIEDRFKKLKIDSLSAEIDENKKKLGDLSKLVNQMFEVIKKMPTSGNIEASLSKIKSNILTLNTRIDVIEDKLKKIESANAVVNYPELRAEVEALGARLNTIEQSTKSANRIQSLPESVKKALESNVANIKGEIEGMINEKFDELSEKLKNQRGLNILAEKKKPTPAAEMETKVMETKPVPAEIETHTPDQIKTEKQEEKPETVKPTPTENKKIKSSLKEIKNKILEEKKKLDLTSEDTNPETSNSESEEQDNGLEGKFICRYCHQPFSSQKILEMHEMICNENPRNKNVNSEPEDKL